MSLNKSDVDRYTNLDDELDRLISRYFCTEDNRMMTKYIYYGYYTEDFTATKPEDSAFVVYGPDIGWKIVENGNELFRIFNIDDERRSQFMNGLSLLNDRHDTYYNKLVGFNVKPMVFWGRKIAIFKSLFS